MASKFHEKVNERAGQRRKRFLKFLRELPMPDGVYNEKLKRWEPRKEAGTR